MAEKWDEGANDSPEVVYEGFSPPTTQGMISASSSFVSATDGTENAQIGGGTATYMVAPPVMENQQGEGSHKEEVDRARLCFVCCNVVSDKNYESIKISMNHSHAPLLVLLSDVLGYKLEDGRLHSQVVCKACYHLLDIIDELQQTLTESKTDVRTKFLETVQRQKLKYPRTDKMLKPRCLRCIQMSQSTARKRGRGRGWKGRAEEGMRGRGRGRGIGRGRASCHSNDGSDNEGEGLGVSEGEICKDVLPSKSLHQSSFEGPNTPDKGQVTAFASKNRPAFTDCSCFDMEPTNYECAMCRKSETEVFYQYCENCMTCQGTFVPWGVNVTLKFYGDQCCITQINARSYFSEEMLCIVTRGLQLKPLACKKEKVVDDKGEDGVKDQNAGSIESPKKSKESKAMTNSDAEDENIEIRKEKNCNEKKTLGRKMVIPMKKEESEEDVDGSLEEDDDEGEEEEEVDDDDDDDNVPDGSSDIDGDDRVNSPLPETAECKEIENSDGDMKLYKPILKIQEGRKVQERFKLKKKTKHKKQKRTTLSDEFENILNSPSLGKRRIKPTEKVKWLAERTTLMRMGGQSVGEDKNRKKKNLDHDRGANKSAVKALKFLTIKKEVEESPSESQGDASVTPGKRKRKLTEKAQELKSNSSNDSVEEHSKTISVSDKHSPKNMESDGRLTDTELLEETADSEWEPNESPELSAEENAELDDEDIENKIIKAESVLREETSEDGAYLDPSMENPLVMIKEEGQPSRVMKPVDIFYPRKRGRPPGKRRKKRVICRSRGMWGQYDDDEELIVKTVDGREVDLNQVSVRSLQEGGGSPYPFYKCPICNKEYKSQGGMQYHLHTHTTTARYSCSLCSYKTIRHGDLKKHFVIHTGLKPYKCDVCHQEFSTSSSYKRHLRIHSGEKPYKCEVCGRDFRNITTRKQHMTLHTGVKNFVCEICGKSFALKHHYTSHRKRHTGEMPFKCIYCDSAFKTHNAVKTHRKKEHPVEEAERIQQNRLRRKSSIKEEKIKLEADDEIPDHEVFQSPSDVLEQAMAATVETVDGVHYEYVDVADPSIPLVSKMIKENWNGRDSVVLTITHIEEDEYEDDEEDEEEEDQQLLKDEEMAAI